MRRAVVDLNSSRPVWQAPATTIRAIRAAFGDGWKVRKVRSVASSDGDGGAGSDEAVRAARGAEIYMGWGVPASVVTAGQATLEWVHTASAGVGSCLTPELRNSGAIFTNSRGIQSEPMADWVLPTLPKQPCKRL